MRWQSRAPTAGVTKGVFSSSDICPVNRHIFKDEKFDILRPYQNPIETSSHDDDDGSDNHAPQNIANGNIIVSKYKPKSRFHFPSSSRSAPRVEKAVELTSSPHISQLKKDTDNS